MNDLPTVEWVERRNPRDSTAKLRPCLLIKINQQYEFTMFFTISTDWRDPLHSYDVRASLIIAKPNSELTKVGIIHFWTVSGCIHEVFRESELERWAPEF